MSGKLKMVFPSEQEINHSYTEALKNVLKPIGDMGFFAAIYHGNIQNLEGKILTIVDASFVDREQRKAVKDLIRRAIWFDWAGNLEANCNKEFPVGIPKLEE